jgi:cation diffusion facilitator CzcD-associated flavoprotein CzcO
MRALQPATETRPPVRVEVLVMGAGMSGLCMAIQLQRAGRHDFVVLEQSSGLGGTWWDNRYPGAHVDVPAPLYSFSFAPNARWRRRFAAAHEIQAYMDDCARRWALAPHLRLGTRITAARWDGERGLWCISTAGGPAYEARFFVCSTGPLSQPRWPDIPGLDSFAGARLHSARWDASVPLAGRRVAVIGTGSTASQLVPPIAATAARLHVFQRTANWVLPRVDRRYGALDRALARLPPYSSAVRALWQALAEWGRRGFDEGSLVRRGMQAAAARHLRSQVADRALRERLRPPYPFGCKRIIYSSDFYPALTWPNVELVTDAIEGLTPGGIVTADGRERSIDVLVCATGFDTTHMLASMEVTGRDGRTLREAWSQGPEAWRGVAVAGFPNLFLLLGPNTGTGHTSTLLYIEPQVRWALACMRGLHERKARWLDVRADLMREHNDALQARLAGTVWTHCRSWYRADSGRIVALWPGRTGEYSRGLAQPDFGNFVLG